MPQFFIRYPYRNGTSSGWGSAVMEGETAEKAAGKLLTQALEYTKAHRSASSMPVRIQELGDAVDLEITPTTSVSVVKG